MPFKSESLVSNSYTPFPTPDHAHKTLIASAKLDTATPQEHLGNLGAGKEVFARIYDVCRNDTVCSRPQEHRAYRGAGYYKVTMSWDQFVDTTVYKANLTMSCTIENDIVNNKPVFRNLRVSCDVDFFYQGQARIFGFSQQYDTTKLSEDKLLEDIVAGIKSRIDSFPTIQPFDRQNLLLLPLLFHATRAA